ncbi:MAG: hypothetical protein ACI8VR_002833 [Candidatus Azotimanducaceae bacterium]|jgi:hypothetical protein
MKLFTGLTKMQISAQTEVNLKGMGVHLAAACRRNGRVFNYYTRIDVDQSVSGVSIGAHQ